MTELLVVLLFLAIVYLVRRNWQGWYGSDNDFDNHLP